MDVDLVMSGRALAGEILASVGFQKGQGYRHGYHEDLGLPIEIPDDILAGAPERVVQIAVEDGFHVYVIGIEDLILDRLRAVVYWNSSADREWAFLLIKSQLEEIDFPYLESVAKKEPTAAITQLVEELKSKAAQGTSK